MKNKYIFINSSDKKEDNAKLIKKYEEIIANSLNRKASIQGSSNIKEKKAV